MHSVARGSLINLATRTLAVALGLAITLYAARLGPAQQGAFALFVAVESVLLALTSGIGVAIARRISHHGERPDGLIGAGVGACVAVGLLVAVALVGLSSLTSDGYRHLWLLAVAAPLMFVTPTLGGLWLGTGQMMSLAGLTLGMPLLTLAGVAAVHALGWPSTLNTLLTAWVLARLAVALVALGAAHRGGWLGRPDGAALWTEIRFVSVIGATNLVGLLNYKVDIFLVERFLGLATTGVYSIAVMVAELLWLASSSITAAAYSRIGTPNTAAAADITVRAAQASVLILCLLSPVLWLSAAVVVPRILGSVYEPALQSLAVLLPGVAIYGAAAPISAWFTNHAGRPSIPAALAVASVLINVAISIIAIPRYGMIGGAVATSASYILTTGAAAIWFARASGTPLGVLMRPQWRALGSDIGRLRTIYRGSSR